MDRSAEDHVLGLVGSVVAGEQSLEEALAHVLILGVVLHGQLILLPGDLHRLRCHHSRGVCCRQLGA